MESVTYLKNIKIPPKKLRFYVPAIKKMTPAEALKVLFYSHERPSRIFYQAIKSALTNARLTLKAQDDLIQFKALIVEEGQKLRRFRAGSRGSAKPIKKRFSHIKIIMTAASASAAAATTPEPVTETAQSPEKKESKAKAPKKEPKKTAEATTKTPAKKKSLKVAKSTT